MRASLAIKTLAAIASAGLLSSAAMGDTLVFNYTYVWNGTATPTGTPFLSATFTSVTSGTVTLTLESFFTAATEFVDGFWFNIDPSLSSSFGGLSIMQTGGLLADSIHTDEDNLKPDGAGQFDIRIDFPNNNVPGDRFYGGNTATFSITGIDGLNAHSFDFLCVDNHGYPGFPTVAHIQGIGPNSLSSWVTVPLPPAAWAGLASLAGVAGFGYLRRRLLRG